MGTLDFKVTDLDVPVGSKNKTATLITGETDAFQIDTGFTRSGSRTEPRAEPALRAPRRPIPAPVATRAGRHRLQYPEIRHEP
jgi:hypothetical protein